MYMWYMYLWRCKSVYLSTYTSWTVKHNIMCLKETEHLLDTHRWSTGIPEYGTVHKPGGLLWEDGGTPVNIYQNNGCVDCSGMLLKWHWGVFLHTSSVLHWKFWRLSHISSHFLMLLHIFFAFLYFFTSVHISSHVSPTMTLTLLLCHLLVLPLATSRGTLTSGQVRLSAALRNLTKRTVDEPSGWNNGNFPYEITWNNHLMKFK